MTSLSNVVFLCFVGTVLTSGPAYDQIGESGTWLHGVSFSSDHADPLLPEHTSSTFDDKVQSTVVLPPTPIISSCAAFIDYFADVAANFSKCIISYARPLRVCENCIEQYLRARWAFNLVMTGKHRDTNNADCGNMILNSDRIQIIVRSYTFVSGLWQDCHCSECFSKTAMENGTAHYRLSNDTLEFEKLLVQTQRCFQNNSLIQPNGTVNNTVCTACWSLYVQINNHYNHLVEVNDHGVCMDIVDAMNSTRLEWSKQFGCSMKEVHPLPVFILSGFFCLLPVIFYVGNCVHVTRKQNIVLRRNSTTPAQNGQGEVDPNDST